MTKKEYDTIRKSVQAFNKDLADFARRTECDIPTLYEDAFTSFGLLNVELKWDGSFIPRSTKEIDGVTLEYDYDFLDGRGPRHESEEQLYVEDIREDLKFWRACLRRAKRYWEMDTDELDKIQDGEKEDKDDKDE